MNKPQHTPTPWDTKPTAGGHQHLIWDENGKTIALVYTDVRDSEFIVRAANAHAALIKLAKSVAAQDEFTCSADASGPIREAYAIINIWRGKAAAALKLANGES